MVGSHGWTDDPQRIKPHHRCGARMATVILPIDGGLSGTPVRQAFERKDD